MAPLINLADLIGDLIRQFGDIPNERAEKLNQIAQTLLDKRRDGRALDLIFICTHNSRRSQLAELWMRVATQYYGHTNIACFSGGTESTAFNHRMVAALSRAGFELNKISEGDNPRYQAKLDTYGTSQEMFSKKYSDDFNPQEGFIAFMVCGHADANCPVVTGADERISLPYIDPKAHDDCDKETKAYDAKVLEIGREMLYLASKI